MKKTKMKISMLSAAIMLAMTAGYSHAQAECKGMKKSACATASGCRWIRGYERSDGRSVIGYCRKLPEKSSQLSDKADSPKKG